jgi:hypothetical protein
VRCDRAAEMPRRLLKKAPGRTVEWSPRCANLLICWQKRRPLPHKLAAGNRPNLTKTGDLAHYAWRERHGEGDLWVVRKGATPAFPGQRGFVGGSMATQSREGAQAGKGLLVGLPLSQRHPLPSSKRSRHAATHVN